MASERIISSSDPSAAGELWKSVPSPASHCNSNNSNNSNNNNNNKTGTKKNQHPLKSNQFNPNETKKNNQIQSLFINQSIVSDWMDAAAPLWAMLSISCADVLLRLNKTWRRRRRRRIINPQKQAGREWRNVRWNEMSLGWAFSSIRRKTLALNSNLIHELCFKLNSTGNEWRFAVKETPSRQRRSIQVQLQSNWIHL